ncbi:MAG: pyruvate, orthophosphate dikinase, partial [Solirubrobacteraceae bacterium]|nr:pyruvate, orthophosphate dikinase [Solirubrobacteraceae bacterium]
MKATSPHVVMLDATTSATRGEIGNKGYSLVRMLQLGLPVPPAFVLPIDECRRFHAEGERLADGTWAAVLDGIARLEDETGRTLGAPENPLLLSVRSGAAVSMPGMMDTILNLGMTPGVQEGLGALSGDAGFARETHVRFVHEYGRTVLRADLDPPGPDVTPEHARAQVAGDTGEHVPEHPHDQLRGAIHAVFGSWSSRRAQAYRRHWGIPEDGGTAVVVQAMVFGNLAAESGTGVLFTRDPLSGAPEPYGEWLPRGQGEDVVSGTHDCLPLEALRAELPAVAAELLEAGRTLEQSGGDVQDIEFTVEAGRLYLLQTRVAKRSPAAAVRTSVDLVNEGLIDRRTAVARVAVEQLAGVLAPGLSAGDIAEAEILATGTPACPGVAAGRVVANSDDAHAAGVPTILARPTTSPEDMEGMIAAAGVVTERGGSTSHAAVVSRALGRPSVVGVGEDATASWTGREVTVDGTTGVVYGGVLPRTT